ncbi:lipopolysaccharide export system protein LptC [Cricetibacter osteomyelitidis]|uniref:Lipopolysaccharide export system protein LptC n=1 Tax=Cricetibacter osteomyelitidis TaxID=1521931 RepID=A0A4R2T437_9PAST|nr:LPS export ABC transporter periplasmic protein LptC [Cricetibacter osteomyelitidis]TCP97739.1 lipopolysaccharide export system protein LptC [Cricetibacter osteomyelitidis]
MNIRWNIGLASVALGLLAWFYSLNQDDDQLQELIKKPDTPDYIGQKMSTTVFSPTGKKQYLALSERVYYYESDGHTNFIKPVVYLYDIESKEADVQSWKLSADTALLTKDKMLMLQGNVVAQSLLAESKLQRVETENALINLSTQDITSDKEVKINGLNFTTTGQKLTGNLHQQVATLKEQVKTHYEINK